MKQQEILFLLGSACVVVFVWIAFTIIHNSLTSTIGTTVLQAITPISPTFDAKIIDAMKRRTVIVPLYTIPSQSQTEIIVTSAPTPAPVATSSSQVASQGGTLQ
ncbi:MAG TPA: hypothetical protein VLB73_05345 [Patescibacteria group bacterium]|nr:hypothetical protein [Patescibacteria group bacterium]